MHTTTPTCAPSNFYRCMKQLADDAAEMLPLEEAEGGKRRGRGRPKKDLRLMDALHQSWQGKVQYEGYLLTTA